MGRYSFSSLRSRLLLLVPLSVVPALGLILYTQMEAGEVKAERSEVELDDLLDEIRSSFDP